MHPVTRAGGLVGRDSEMALLAGPIRAVARGSGGAVLIEGELGIGKSALVRAALAGPAAASARSSGGPVTNWARRCRCSPCWTGYGYGNHRESAAENDRELLLGEVSTDRGPDVPAMLAEQLLTLIAEECAAQPTILVIDDLQWADRASITLWARLADRRSGCRCC